MPWRNLSWIRPVLFIHPGLLNNWSQDSFMSSFSMPRLDYLYVWLFCLTLPTPPRHFMKGGISLNGNSCVSLFPDSRVGQMVGGDEGEGLTTSWRYTGTRKIVKGFWRMTGMWLEAVFICSLQILCNPRTDLKWHHSGLSVGCRYIRSKCQSTRCSLYQGTDPELKSGSQIVKYKDNKPGNNF